MKKRNIIIISLILLMVLGIWLGSKSLDLNVISHISEVDKENIMDTNASIKDLDGKDLETEGIEVTEEIGEIKNLSLLAVGDIMYHMPQIRSAQNKDGSYDFISTFKYVEKYIKDADLSLANFETVTAGKEIGYSGFPRFNSPKETIPALKEVGFDILSTANNHSLDQGKQGIISTLETIRESDLKSIGTYDRPNTKPHIEELNGIKLGLLSYTYGVNGLSSLLSQEELSYMINIIDENRIIQDINELKSQDTDLIVIYIHWGYEYHNNPSDYQMELGRKIIQWGGDIILGSHPHVIQKSEIINKEGKDKLIVYSMGNFLSNQRESSMGNPLTENGLMVNINIEKDMKTKETIIKDIDYIPTWIHRPIEGNDVRFEILPTKDILEEKIDIYLEPKILRRIEKSYEDTMKTLNSD